MAKLVTKKTTTTVTEEVELIPATPGEEINHRYMKVCGYGSYRGDDGESVDKPQIVLNAKWLAEAGFQVGDQIDVSRRSQSTMITLPSSSNPALRQKFRCKHSAITQALLRERLFYISAFYCKRKDAPEGAPA